MTSIERRQLKRTFRPYVGQIVILSAVSFGAVAIAWSRSVWGLVMPIPVAWLLFGALLATGLKYKIYWDQNKICQSASGGSDVCIGYDEIREIRLEKANLNEMIAMSSPYRRIAIYGATRQELGRINVSLRHFRDDDIRQLMAFIHGQRPDLPMPKGFA